MMGPDFQEAMAQPLYAELIAARQAYDAALVAAFGDAAERYRYTGAAATLPATKDAYEAVRAADLAFYAQFKARA
jgi:hypothetical protein